MRTPNELVLELLLLCHFWRKSIKKWDRQSVDRQTDGHTQ